MTDNFAGTVTGWHDFYLLAGTAAATLVGLLFVAVSLKLELLADPANAELRRRVINSFEGFLYVLLFALVFLIPDTSPEGLGWPLLIFSVLRAISVEQRARQSYRTRRRSSWRPDALVAYQLPAAGYLLVVWFTVPLVRGHPDTDGLSWFVAIVLTLLASAAGSAWDLLLRVERSERSEQPDRQEALNQDRRR